ncbi:hypothetical protein DV738_g5567, partial [Chaetothyriales sp. CBS 135597]
MIYAMVVSGAATTMPALPKEPQVPTWLHNYRDVFDNSRAVELPPVSGFSHAIELENGAEPPYGPLYNLSANELKVLRDYLDDALKTGRIRQSTSPAGAPVLFIPKKDRSLRLCVNYRGLNKITKKNQYPLPLISKTLNCLIGAKRFTKLDLKDTYHQIRIQEGNEWKTAFRTRALLLRHYNPNAPVTLETDTLGFTISTVISQQAANGGSTGAHWHPVAFFSRKLKEAKQNYKIHDTELLAIVEGFRQFQHYLKGNPHPVCMRTDHQNLRYFMITKELNNKQTRWAEKLAHFNFFIEYQPEEARARPMLSILQKLLQRTEAAPQEDPELKEDMRAAAPTLLARLQEGISPNSTQKGKDNIKNAYTHLGQRPGSKANTRGCQADNNMRTCHMARQVVMAAISRQTTYNLDEATLSNALLEAQRTCTFTQAKKAAMSREHKASKPTTWQMDPKGLLHKNDQIYIPRKLSTAFHLQTDGQTERQNQILEHYLRCYASHWQDDWAEMLPQAKFVYNSARHVSTGMLPFKALYRYEPQVDNIVKDDATEGGAAEDKTAEQRLTTLAQLQ